VRIFDARTVRSVTPVALTKIIVGCDGSDGARDALRFAALLGRADRAELILASVYRHDRDHAVALLAEAERAVPYGTRACGPRDAEADRNRREPAAAHGRHDRRLLERAARRLPRRAAGRAAPQLVERAEQLSLLVTGSRGYGPVRRAVLGSVSAQVLRALHCPVLVVPRGVGEVHRAAA
jgi:nucleotide-binding universal stress UspA family protein